MVKLPFSLQETLETLSVISDKLKVAKKMSEEVVLDCGGLTGRYSSIIRITPGIRRKLASSLGKTIKLPYACAERISIKSIPFLRRENAVHLTNEGHEVSLNELSDDVEDFLIEIDWPLSVESISDLVDTRTEMEPLGDETTYWIHTMLKHPKFFTQKWERMDLQDIDVSVDVAIDTDVKMSIPGVVVRNLETVKKWIDTSGRSDKMRLTFEHMKLKKVGGKKVDFKRIHEINEYCSPEKFKEFVAVERPFRLDECYRGRDFFDNAPFPTFPREMIVCTRTDLDLSKPASEGKMVYKKSDFRYGLLDMFS